MIKEFNELSVRPSGVVYQSSLEQVKKLYSRDPIRAGELAIMILEVTLTGQHSSDDADLDIMVETSKAVAAKDKQKYEDKTAAKEAKQISDLQLDIIADLINQGYSQVKVGEIIGEKKQTINYRLGVIKSKYPHLLNESKSQTSTNVQNLTIESKIGGSQILTESKSQISQKSNFLTNESEIFTENFDGQTDLSKKSKFLTENFDEIGQKVKQVKNYDNDNDNDNVNDNVNVSRVSPIGETLETISLSELNRMGATYKDVGGGVVEFPTGVRMKIEYDF
jgi:hypothetical protein